MKGLMNIFAGNSKKENALLVFIFVLLFGLCFLIPSFSALPVYNYITIAVVAVLCLLILLWKFIFHKILLDHYFFLLVLFNIAIFISNLFNKDATHIITYITLSGMSFCLYQLFIIPKYRNTIRCIVFTSFLLFAFYFIIYYKNSVFNLSIDRVGDHFDNLNTVGYYFLYAFVSAISFVNKKKRLSYLFLIPAFLFLFLLVRTGSRSALLISVACILVYSFYFFRGNKIIIPIIFDCSLIVAGIVIIIIFEKTFNLNIFSRIIELLDFFRGKGMDYSTANRIDLFFQSIYLFLKKPVFGWGNNVFSIYSSERLFAHNNLTELLCSFGLFGFLPFEYIIVQSYLRIKKSKLHSDSIDYSLLLLICFFLIQFFYVNSQLKFDWIAIAIFASEATICFNKTKVIKHEVVEITI